MIQKMLTKYGLLFHVACVCLLPVLSVGRTRSFSLVPLLWLSLVAVELMFLLPSVRRAETLADARQRVVRMLVWDPFLYIGLAVIGVAAVQWMNSGCALIYLPDADIWQMSKPPVPWAPFSVEPRAALSQLSVFTACVAVGLILRVALSKTAKRLLLQVLAAACGCVALFSVFQASQKVQPYLERTAGLDASAMGIFFGFWLLLGMGLFADMVARDLRGRVLFSAIGIVGNLMGMLFFASALSVVIYIVLTALLFIYWMIYLSPHVSKAAQLKLFIGSLLVAGAISAALMYLCPQNPVAEKLKAAWPVTEYWDSLSSIKKVRADTAIGIWQDHPWVGVGADGFYHFVGLSVDSKDWNLIKTDQAYVYNDNFQFLCEYGVLGGGFLLAAVIVLLMPVCYRARIAWKNKTGGDDDGRVFILRLSPIVVAGVLAAGVCFLESWIVSPFRSAGLLLAWTCVMSVMPAFLPSQTHDGARG